MKILVMSENQTIHFQQKLEKLGFVLDYKSYEHRTLNSAFELNFETKTMIGVHVTLIKYKGIKAYTATVDQVKELLILPTEDSREVYAETVLMRI